MGNNILGNYRYSGEGLLGEKEIASSSPERFLLFDVLEHIHVQHGVSLFIVEYINYAFVANSIGGDKQFIANTLEDLIKVVRDDHKDHSFRFHENILTSKEYVWDEDKFKITNVRTGNNFSAFGEIGEICLLENKQSMWLQIYNKEYLEDPQNWAAAYSFIEHHPIFWRCIEYKAGENIVGYWLYDRGASGISTSVSYRGKDKKPRVMLEHGGVTRDFLTFSHDTAIDAYSDDLHSGYVQMADNINKKFNPDGSYRSP